MFGSKRDRLEDQQAQNSLHKIGGLDHTPRLSTIVDGPSGDRLGVFVKEGASAVRGPDTPTESDPLRAFPEGADGDEKRLC